ncbi:3'(2'),5'-bisphosphate nucleotidase CysQ [Beijerinckia indica]|uniref:3'(2'),5'-bisphosphate nucleotidase CysQ n=1 Tax=Beijerinckia indica subsp. indica (strain ATCC 9039 / DSM 1715 / NCIMB 8712) TaxID=395963 RepID=B2II80_BEII9|nr:3'(2'),5'-bisphosphate nucleotidase CysQ [Beijerinckia indica]ACB94663.1 3'(2'),5'-bisphosphate nucleotidase [Beijerinckia indica subsp. indica ATCC 9039]
MNGTKIQMPPAAQQKVACEDRDTIAEIFAAIALRASVEVMRIYASDCHARRKPDQSPVCDADEQAEAIILEQLAVRLPHLPVVAEEASARGDRPRCGSSFILVDPVDGTKEFLSHTGEFTINIALIEAGTPIAGVVYAPALDRLWLGGTKAFVCTVAPGGVLPPVSARHAIHVRRAPSHGLTALASRSHSNAETEAFLGRLAIAERHSAGSSLKFCAVAEGEADVYPRFGPTMEWDTAAGDAVLRAAGGLVLGLDNQPLHYGKATELYRNDFFIAWGDRALVPEKPIA